jgi:hypothetical protein
VVLLKAWRIYVKFGTVKGKIIPVQAVEALRVVRG